MLTKNRLGNYLLYAIGEIFLVMIGILLALQVNNWNTNRQKVILEKKLLEQVKYDLVSALKDIESDMELLKLGRRSHFRIEDYIKSDAKYADTMCFDFEWLIKDEYIFPRSSTFYRIKEEGIDIIHNDSIKTYLLHLFESVFVRITTESQYHPDIETYFSNYYQNNFKPNQDYNLKYIEVLSTSDTIQQPYTLVENGVTKEMTRGFVPLDFEKLKKDPKFQMLLKNSFRYRQYKLARYKSAEWMINKVIPLIDEELGLNEKS